MAAGRNCLTVKKHSFVYYLQTRDEDVQALARHGARGDGELVPLSRVHPDLLLLSQLQQSSSRRNGSAAQHTTRNTKITVLHPMNTTFGIQKSPPGLL